MDLCHVHDLHKLCGGYVLPGCCVGTVRGMAGSGSVREVDGDRELCMRVADNRDTGTDSIPDELGEDYGK